MALQPFFACKALLCLQVDTEARTGSDLLSRTGLRNHVLQGRSRKDGPSKQAQTAARALPHAARLTSSSDPMDIDGNGNPGPPGCEALPSVRAQPGAKGVLGIAGQPSNIAKSGQLPSFSANSRH